MLPEYAEVLRLFIPPVDTETVKRLQKDLLKKGYLTAHLFAPQLPDKVCQGGVLGPLPFVWRDSDGKLRRGSPTRSNARRHRYAGERHR